MNLQALLAIGCVESAWAKDAEMALRVPDKAINAKKKKKSVNAGGPGSGCQGPNCGRKTAEVAQKNGYKLSNSGGDRFGGKWQIFTHPSTGHEVVVRGNGDWEHRRVRPDLTNSDADYRSVGYRQSDIRNIRQGEERVPQYRNGSGPKMLSAFLKSIS